MQIASKLLIGNRCVGAFVLKELIKTEAEDRPALKATA
jgi:hypothetical protein